MLNCDGSRLRRGHVVEEPDDLVLADLRELLVPEPNRTEVAQLVERDERVDLLADQRGGFGGGHRDGGDYAVRPGLPRPAGGRDHRGACRKPVVHDHGGLAAELGGRSPAVQPAVERRCGFLRLPDSVCNLVLGQPIRSTQVDAVARGHRADGVFGLPRVADLANGDYVERRVERTRDFGRDLDASACEANDDQIGRSLGPKLVGQLSSGFDDV